ncbi:MAG: InlB B-repeat-containing protein [Lachnospiraceae bacterium]|jgi:pilin isopeptide linkage protein/uncharacterized repeat protein (TIGR02543 family)
MRKSRNLKSMLSVLLALFFVAVSLTAGTVQVHADSLPASGTWGTCAWDIDANGVLTIHGGTGVTLGSQENAPWYNYRNDITSVKTSGTIICPEYLGGLFEDCKNMVTADVSGFNTSGTKSLQQSGHSGDGAGIFTNCQSLTTITGLENWDTSNFTSISSAFMDCKSLTSVAGLSNWNVSNVRNMRSTFSCASALTDLSALSSWNTTSLTDMGCTFERTSVQNLDFLRSWDTSNVTDMQSLFFGCRQLSDISGIEHWDMSSCKSMSQMFRECPSLKEITVPAGWNLSSMTNTYTAFYSHELSKITISDNFRIPTPGQHAATDNDPFGTPTLTYSGKESDGTWGLGSEDASVRYTRDELYQYGLSHPLTGTWYAQVKKSVPDTYTIHFDANGGSGQMSDQTANVGEKTVLKANAFTRSGYTFIGWTTAADGSGTTYVDEDEVTDIAQANGSVTLYAKWMQNAYTVHFDANGGSGDMSDQKITVGESTALKANAFTRSNYTFTGWNTAADGSGTSYTDGAEVTDLAQADGSVTLYAQWKQNVYTVHFDANGGSGDMSDQKITVGESTALTANAFTRSGYTFTGWNTAADGSGTSYADGTEVTDLAQADGSVTLYAQWKQNTTPAPVYKIIKGDGQTWTKGTSTGISMTADGPFAKFEKLLIDGSEVAQSDYSATSGSTIVTTTAAYAESLSLGQHTLTVQYTDGSASGTFYVAEKQTDTTEKPADGEDDTKQDDTTQPAADKADALLQIAAKKILAGGTLADGQFSFELRDAAGQTLQTAKNGSDGLVMFDRLSFASEGTYTYTVREVLPEDADPSLDGIQKDGVTYDETVYTVTVNVARNADTGKLEASAVCRAEGSSENTEMVFTNCAVPASDVETVAGDDSVDTGDSLRTVMYAALMIACLAFIIFLVSRRHRENKAQ